MTIWRGVRPLILASQSRVRHLLLTQASHQARVCQAAFLTRLAQGRVFMRFTGLDVALRERPPLAALGPDDQEPRFSGGSRVGDVQADRGTDKWTVGAVVANNTCRAGKIGISYNNMTLF